MLYQYLIDPIGWLGYTDEKIVSLLKEKMAQGWRHFKIKVGHDLEDDKRRCRIVRDVIGEESILVSLTEI